MKNMIGKIKGILLSFLAVCAMQSFGAVRAQQPKKFLVFDGKVSLASIRAHPNEYVFVWGSSGPGRDAAFSLHSRSTALSAYFPYSRDPDSAHDVAYWHGSHSDWMASGCGTSDPMTLYADKNIVLDITNPAVISWQLGNFSRLPVGVSTVALDNFHLSNVAKQCGHLSKSGGVIRSFTGSRYDPAYADAVVSWIKKVASELHRKNIRVVVNHVPDLTPEGDDPGSSVIQDMVGAVDGILDERAQNAMRDPAAGLLLAKFVNYADSKGKWVYLVYQLDELTRNRVESAVAHYLTLAGAHTAIYVSVRDNAYGSEPNFLGFDKSIGKPCGSAHVGPHSIYRMYEGGKVVFVPAGQSPLSELIPDGYQDSMGREVKGYVQISGGNGLVLYRVGGKGCSIRR